MSYAVQKFQITIDQAKYPNLNPAQFARMVDIELNNFIKHLYTLECEFVALQDLTALNVATKFYKINEYYAVRQLTHYDTKTSTMLVLLEASVLVGSDSSEEAPLAGEKPVSKEGEVTPGVTAATESTH
jgi:hypothetical protein